MCLLVENVLLVSVARRVALFVALTVKLIPMNVLSEKQLVKPKMLTWQSHLRGNAQVLHYIINILIFDQAYSAFFKKIPIYILL